MMKALGLDRLSVEERLQLVEEIWESIAADSRALPLTETQKEEINRRLDAYQANPDAVIPWEVVKTEAEARLRRPWRSTGC